MKTQIATILLAVVAAMYLSIGGGVRHLNSTDAATFAPHSAVARALRAPQWSSPDWADPPASGSHEGTNNASDSRECRLSLLFDSDCLFD